MQLLGYVAVSEVGAMFYIYSCILLHHTIVELNISFVILNWGWEVTILVEELLSPTKNSCYLLLMTCTGLRMILEYI